MGSKAEELRAELSAVRQRGRCGCYPQELRQRAAAYARERMSRGSSLSAIGRELGVAQQSIKSWVSRQTGTDKLAHGIDLSLIPVVVRSAERRVSASVGQLEVQFAGGVVLRATGISSRALAQACEVLRRTA